MYKRKISNPVLVQSDAAAVNVILVSNYDFQSEDPKELSVNKGDLLKFVARKHGGWLLVKSLDKLNSQGLIPASYASIAINDTKDPIDIHWLNENAEDDYQRANSVPVRSSTSSFHNPYLVQKPQLKDFKADSFNKFSPSLPPQPQFGPSGGPASPGSPGASPATGHAGPTQEPPGAPGGPGDSGGAGYNPMEDLVGILISNCLLHNERYWYRVDLRYAGRQRICLGKFYQNFYNLQANIYEKEGIPRLPPPIELNQQDVSYIMKRCNELNIYINKVLKLNLQEFVDWIDYRNNNLVVINNGELTDDEINNRILPNSENLLFKELIVSIISGNSTTTLQVNANEITSVQVLKAKIHSQLGPCRLALAGSHEPIDSVPLNVILSNPHLIIV